MVQNECRFAQGACLVAVAASLLFGLSRVSFAASENLLLDTDFTSSTVWMRGGHRFLGERWHFYGNELLKAEVTVAQGFDHGRCIHLSGTKLGTPEEESQFTRNRRKDDWHGQVWLGYQFDAPEPDTTYTFSLRGHGKGSFMIGMAALSGLQGSNDKDWLGISDPLTLGDQDQTLAFSWKTPADLRLEAIRITIRPQSPDFDAFLGDFKLVTPEVPDSGPAVITPLPYTLDRSRFPAFSWKVSDPDGIAPERFVLKANNRYYTATAPELKWDGETLTFRPIWPEARYAITLKVYDRSGNLYMRNDIISLARELASAKGPDKGLADLHIADPVCIQSRQLEADADWQIDAAGGARPLLQSVSIDGGCSAPHVWSDLTGDFTSARTLAASIIRNARAKTEREKAFACWRWVQEHIYEGASTCGGTWLQQVNCFGGGCCGDFTHILTVLLVGGGLESAIVGAPGHVMNTTWWDGQPHHFDPVARMTYAPRDGGDLASLADIKADPRLLYRNVKGDGTQPWGRGDIRSLMHVWMGDMNFRGATQPHQLDRSDPDVIDRIAYDLRAGESFTLLGGNDGIWTRSRIGEPPDYANGLFVCEPDFSKSSWEKVLPAQNLRVVDGGISPASPGKATLSYGRKSPYNIASAVIWGTFTRRSPDDSVELFLSRDPAEGKTRQWTRVWRMEQTGTVPISIDLRRYLTIKALGYDPEGTVFGYQLRFEINASQAENVAIRNLKILTYTQHTGVTVPQLAMGKNLVHFNRDSQTGPVTVTWAWREAGGFSISDPDPAVGDVCTLTAAVTNRGAADARDVLVRFMGGNSPRFERTLGERVIPRLEPGKTATVSIPWVAVPYPSPSATADKVQPWNRNEHPYSRLCVRVDPDTKIAENDKYDNEAVLHVQVRERADLVINPEHIQLTTLGAQAAKVAVQNTYVDGKDDGRIKDVSFSFQGGKPQRVRVCAIVRNLCQSKEWLYVHGSPARNVVVRFYDGDPDASGRQIGSDQIIPLIAATEYDRAEVEWPTDGLTGTHRLFILVDPDNAIAESDETPASNRATVSVVF